MAWFKYFLTYTTKYTSQLIKNIFKGWINIFKLYTPDSSEVLTQANMTITKLNVAATGRSPWMSRIYDGQPCCGYASKPWTFNAISKFVAYK